MKPVRQKSIFVVIAMAFFVTLWIPEGFAKDDEWQKEIHIPFITCRTGVLATWGKIMYYGAQIAAEEINARGGVRGMKLLLDVYDDGSDAAQSAMLVRKVEPKALVLFGPNNSNTAETGLPVANSLRVPAVSGCCAKTSIVAESRPWTFTNLMPVDLLSIKAAELFLKKEVEVKTAVLLVDKADPSSTLQGASIVKGLKEKGIAIKEEIAISQGDIDPAPVITRVKDLNPDAVAISVGAEMGGAFIKEMERQGLKKKILCAQGSWTPDLIRVAGSAAEGIYGINQMWPADPKLKSLYDKCKEKSGGPPPNFCSFTCYELTWFLAQAIEKAGITNNPGKRREEREKLLKVIQTMERDGILGKWRFREDGVGSSQAHLLTIKGGNEIEVK